jgi:hypothetical protein
MKLVSPALIKGYSDLLHNMEVNGKTIEFFELRAPFPSEEPYIILTSHTTFNENTKDSFNGESIVDLEVVTSFKGDYGNMDLADAITQEVLERVAPAPGKSGVSAEGFTVISAKVTSLSAFDRKYPDSTKYGNKITFQHFIFQN